MVKAYIEYLKEISPVRIISILAISAVLFNMVSFFFNLNLEPNVGFITMLLTITISDFLKNRN